MATIAKTRRMEEAGAGPERSACPWPRVRPNQAKLCYRLCPFQCCHVDRVFPNVVVVSNKPCLSSAQDRSRVKLHDQWLPNLMYDITIPALIVRISHDAPQPSLFVFWCQYSPRRARHVLQLCRRWEDFAEETCIIRYCL